jgi:hypothetical protein
MSDVHELVTKLPTGQYRLVYGDDGVNVYRLHHHRHTAAKQEPEVFDPETRPVEEMPFHVRTNLYVLSHQRKMKLHAMYGRHDRADQERARMNEAIIKLLGYQYAKAQ